MTSTKALRPLSLSVAALAMAGSVAMAGCESMALTAFGVGTSAGVSHTLNGYAYRTFTVSETRIKVATLVALQKMNIKVASSKKTTGGEVIMAKAEGREIEIQLEALTSNTTRMRAVARDGLLNDSATAIEIIAQTERLLGNA